ncbi:hypothetical protein BDY24DRAFT_350149 [Mrakia frigida]|uniref:tryptophan--tRNA ligase MSW1 n=1 Tax=Mrakia frigida TaxID=29902 RepID=UPI003FCBFDC5
MSLRLSSSCRSISKSTSSLSLLSTRSSSSATPPSTSPSSSSSSSSPPPRVIFSGIQPSGTIHLGNYLGAISNWVDLQNSASSEDSIYYSIVGLHAITIPKDPKTLKADRRDMMASLLACGIDPERSTLYHQDMVPEHAELAWILNTITPMGKLNRMTTWKGKIADQKNGSVAEVSDDELHLGLFAYPVLQAADILLYKATHVPVGEDQEQHLELSRDIAKTFNKRFGKNTFPQPRVLITPSKRILSLRNPLQKMSKSSPDLSSRILLTDPYPSIQSKLRTALTDSLPFISFDPVSRPGVSNLLSIHSACTGENVDHAADRFRDFSMKEFKSAVAEGVEGKIGAVRREMERFGKRGGAEDAYLREVGERGARKARERAREVLEEVKEKVGLGAL